MSDTLKCTKCDCVYHEYNQRSSHSIACAHHTVWTNKNTFSPKHIQYYNRAFGECPLPTAPPWCPKRPENKKEDLKIPFDNINKMWDGSEYVNAIFSEYEIKELNKNLCWYPITVIGHGFPADFLYTTQKYFSKNIGADIVCILHMYVASKSAAPIKTIYMYVTQLPSSPSPSTSY